MTEFIKPSDLTDHTYISSNFQEKNLLVAIDEAVRSLPEVIGDNLYQKICEMINCYSLAGKYKILKEDYLDFYLYWRAVYELQFGNTLKTTQTGTVRTTDPSVESVSIDDLKYLDNKYKDKYNTYILKTQRYIENNSQYFPEYKTENCLQQKPINNFNCPIQLDTKYKKCYK